MSTATPPPLRSVRTRVPLRLDLSGGTLDIWPLYLSLPEPGVTVNVALDVPTEAHVTPHAPGDASVRLVSRDLALDETFASPGHIRSALYGETSKLPLLARAALAAAPDGGYTLTTHAQSPSGAGLGGSSALGGAMIAALHAARGIPIDTVQIQRLAQDIETSLMRKPTGYQDYYPPLYGGLLALEGATGGIQVERLEVDLDALASRLRLIYTGEPHVSAVTNWETVRAFIEGKSHAQTSIRALAELSLSQRDAFRAGDVEAALRIAVNDGLFRQRMAPGVSTAEIERIDAGVRSAGAVGTKICGAGGGGCLIVVLEADPGTHGAVDAWLEANLARGGSQQMPLRLDPEGLQVEVLA